MAESNSTATGYDKELERRARDMAEQRYQIAFGAICRTFNMCGDNDQYQYSPETIKEVEAIMLRLMVLTSTAPITINRPAFVQGDHKFREFVAAAKRRPRKAKMQA